eukprot:TRINITY_DN9002_c0_g1_i2.p1 TRINITY_DN9002_c0_g1~~TRINITY_DN9002_c0_g1_i2.p1  ORF type:complete len:474 (+),score=82.89 TRINITY_DN9002_c0_g1_i2:606-2027(+)
MQTAEGSFRRAIALQGATRDDAMEHEHAVLVMERRHREASEEPLVPHAQDQALCLANGLECGAQENLHQNGAWQRDGVVLDMVKQVKFSRQDALVPAAHVLHEDRFLVKAARLGHALHDRRLHLNGWFIARLTNVTLAPGGLLCNTTVTVSTTRLRRAGGHPEPACAAFPHPKATRVTKAVVLLERWGLFWQHFMQDLSFKLAAVKDLLMRDTKVRLVLESGLTVNVLWVIRWILGMSFDLGRIVQADTHCLTMGLPYCSGDILEFDEVFFTEMHPVGWLMGQPPVAMGRELQRAILPTALPVRNAWLLLMRAQNSSRSIDNGADTAALLRAHAPAGTEVVVNSPEELSLLDLSTLIRRCSLILTPHGGQGFNVGFAQPGTVLIELVPAVLTEDGPYLIHAYAASFGLEYWILPVEGFTHRSSNPMITPLRKLQAILKVCLLYTSDAADEEDSVDLGGRRIIKKKKNGEASGG